MRENPGSQVTLLGSGFCSGTQVEVGNPDAIVAATDVSLDGRSMTFRIPRLASDGPVTVIPPAAAPKYASTNVIDIRTFRNHYGFQFDNFAWGSLSWSELIDSVGDDDLFARVNPCWPFDDCSIQTPIPDPMAYATFLVMKVMARASKGHCFGMVRTEQELLAGRVNYDRFRSGVDHPFDLGSINGPDSDLRHYLDGRHVAQWTEEIAREFLAREKDVLAQVQRIRNELQAGRYPGVALMPGTVKLKGHVVTAYDVVEIGNGAFDIFVYDNNTPFTAAEMGSSSNALALHREREVGDKGVIHVVDGEWTLDRGDKGIWRGTGGTIWAIPLSALPSNPTLISGLRPATMVLFGSPGGAARVSESTPGAEWLPTLDDHAPSMAVGALIAQGPGTVSHTVRGTENGTYSELLVGSGFAGGVTAAPTRSGVVDRIRADPAARSLSFRGSRSRALQLNVVATNPRGDTHSAIVTTTTSARGRELVRLAPRGVLLYAHRGVPTSIVVELSTTSPSADVARAILRPLAVDDGDRVAITPRNWRSLSKVDLKVEHADGTRVERTLTVQPVTPNVDVQIQLPSIRSAANRYVALLRTELGSVPTNTVGGVVLELKRGEQVVASKSVPVPEVRSGMRVDRWRLPVRIAPGEYRLIAHVTLVSGGNRSASLTITRGATVRLEGQSAEYVVTRGDTLWDIAKRQLRDGASGAAITREWHRWYEANLAVIGDDPNLILPGQILSPPD